MRKIKEKKERALGVKLFIKAERCNSPKCAMIRKPYRPGMHGNKQKRGSISEFCEQLREKQKLQLSYGLNNRQLRNIFKNLDKNKIIQTLEKRLDKVVFLLGFTKSPRIARQLISHGHIIVNGRKVTIPSYIIKIGDSIEIRKESKNLKIFEGLEQDLKKHNCPDWLNLNTDLLLGKCVNEPDKDTQAPCNIDLVGEFYSR